MPNVRLVVAGSNHPMTPGYVESVAEQLKDNPRIEFTGYVAEEDIPELFRTASVLVLPYSSATGASGVAHLACEFGVPIISAGIEDFREMAWDEGIAIEFYETGNAADLAERLHALAERRRTHARNVGAEFLGRIAHDDATDHSPISALLRSASARPGSGADLALSPNSVVGSFALGDLSRGCARGGSHGREGHPVGRRQTRRSERGAAERDIWPEFRLPVWTCWACRFWSALCSACSSSAFCATASSATPRRGRAASRRRHAASRP